MKSIFLGVFAILTIQPVSARADHIVFGPRGAAVSFVEEDEQGFAAKGFHGAAGDLDVVCAGLFPALDPPPMPDPPPPVLPPPPPGAVRCYSRLNGSQLADLPPPPGHAAWSLPFDVRMTGHNRFVVLDAGYFSNDPTQPAGSFLVEYSYRRKLNGTLEFTILRVIETSAAPLPIFFVANVVVLPDGRIVLPDQAAGALWLVNQDSSLVPWVIPSGPTALIPQLAGGMLPPGEVFHFTEGLDFRFAELPSPPFPAGSSFAPGANYVAYHDGYVYWANMAQQNIYRLAVSTASDNRLPWNRAADIQAVPGGEFGADELDSKEILVGLSFNQFRPESPWLYVSNVQRARIDRINVVTGERQEVVTDANGTLLNSCVTISFLPGLLGSERFVCSNDQEHRYALVNTLLASSVFEPPWRLTMVYVY